MVDRSVYHCGLGLGESKYFLLFDASLVFPTPWMLSFGCGYIRDLTYVCLVRYKGILALYIPYITNFLVPH